MAPDDRETDRRPHPAPGAETTQLDLGGRTAHRVAEDHRAFVVVHGGPQIDVVEVSEGESLVVGRSAEADVVVDDGRVSRNNSELALVDGRLILRDLGGRNGTRVRGEVLRGGSVELTRDDEVRIGPLRLIVAAIPAPAPTSGRPAPTDDEEVIVADPKMREIFELTRRLADAPTTVLICGETGVGKEIVAEQLHRQSARAGGPFVRVNCAAVPESLVEGELFGHAKGAFTGAHQSRAGHLEAASGGTLLLDEIGDLPLTVQPKLLRVLESKQVQRLGDRRERAVDTRVVCATHRDLEAAVATGGFRQDLYYRIAGFKLAVPPLRERTAELRPLSQRFAARFARRMGAEEPAFSASVWPILEAYPWPGNIRQLRNAIEHATILAAGATIEPSHLPEEVKAPAAAIDANPGATMRETVDDAERRAISRALHEAGGKRTEAAARLGVSRRTLQYRLAKYGIKE